jgi:hypothetical protein
MKKLIGLLGAAGFLIPSVAMAGSVNNQIGAAAKRATTSGVSRSDVTVNSTIHKNNTMYVAGANWGGSISADAENLSWGDRDMTYNYGRGSAQTSFYQNADTWSNEAEFGSEGSYGFEGGYEQDGNLTAHASQETDYNERRRDTSSTESHENSGTIGGSRSWGGSQTETSGDFEYGEETEGGSVNGFRESSDTHTEGEGSNGYGYGEDSTTTTRNQRHPKQEVATTHTSGQGGGSDSYSEDSNTHTRGGGFELNGSSTEGGGDYSETANTDSHETSVYGEGTRTTGGSDTLDRGRTVGNVDTVAEANVHSDSSGSYGGDGGYEVAGAGAARADGTIDSSATVDGATASSYGSGHESFVDGAGTVNRDFHWNGYAGSLHENGTTKTLVKMGSIEVYSDRGFETSAFSGTNWD